MEKQFQQLTFTDNFMFWKVMTTNPKLCKKIVELILRKKVRKIVYLNSEESIEITSDGRGVRLDVYLEDDNTVYNLEMQTTENKNLPKRTRYYQGMIDLKLIERGSDFGELKKCFIVFICTFDPFGKGIPLYTFENSCLEIPALKLQDESTKIFVNGAAKDVPDELGQFIRFLADGTVEPGVTAEIHEAVEKVKSHKEWERDYMTLMMRDRENIEKGRVEGRTEGLLEGLIGLFNDGLLALSEAVKRSGLSESEFLKRAKEKQE